jgi:hypothetical protein
VVYGEVFHRELKKMSQLHVPGAKELSEDLDETVELVMAYAGVERRLRGLSAEERLRGLAPEELLRSLNPIERARLRELLLKQENR